MLFPLILSCILLLRQLAIAFLAGGDWTLAAGYNPRGQKTARENQLMTQFKVDLYISRPLTKSSRGRKWRCRQAAKARSSTQHTVAFLVIS